MYTSDGRLTDVRWTSDERPTDVRRTSDRRPLTSDGALKKKSKNPDPRYLEPSLANLNNIESTIRISFVMHSPLWIMNTNVCRRTTSRDVLWRRMSSYDRRTTSYSVVCRRTTSYNDMKATT